MEYARSRSWTENDAVCIFTHSHDLDYPLARHFLTQPVGYVGVIASRRKSQNFQDKLRADGGDQGEAMVQLWREKMHCPIGLPLSSKNPKVIAVSVAAELLKDWALAAPASDPAEAR